MITSAHATEHDWRIGYTFKTGSFQMDEQNQLFGINLQSKRTDIVSSNPKVYCAAGNCLMGHIKSANCMALAWMKSANVL